MSEKKMQKAVTGPKMSPAQIVAKYGIYLLLLVIVLILSVANSNFRTASNLLNVFLQVSNYAVLGAGMTFVIMTGGIDVSVGATMVVSAAVYAVTTQEKGVSEPVGLILMMIVAAIVGVINGVGVAYLQMPAFLVTLATQCMGRGLSLVLTGGVSYRNLGVSFTVVSKYAILGIPLMVWIPIIMFVLGYLLLHRTIYGRKVMAIGGNANAAQVSGINVKRITMSTYIILGVVSGVAGFMTMSRLGSYYAAMGESMEFMVIAAVVIGGTSLAGGTGTMMGTVVGTLIIGVINNALNLFGVNADWQQVARGIVIFIAVMFDAMRTRINTAD